jgi:hypothetical protein
MSSDYELEEIDCLRYQLAEERRKRISLIETLAKLGVRVWYPDGVLMVTNEYFESALQWAFPQLPRLEEASF